MKTQKPSLRRAINAKCRECIYDPRGGGGTWKQQVEACTATGCPLYPVRPLSDGEKPVFADSDKRSAPSSTPSPIAPCFGAETAEWRP